MSKSALKSSKPAPSASTRSAIRLPSSLIAPVMIRFGTLDVESDSPRVLSR